jgi:hypothetical protein
MAVSALVVALGAGTDQPTAAVPACLAVGAVCAALVAHLLFASARTVADPRLMWMSAGVTVAFAGMVATLLGQPTISPHGPISQAEDSLAARYVIWHVALLAAGAIAVSAMRTRPRELFAFGAGGLALLLWASLADAPLGDLAAADGSYHATVRTVVGFIALAQIAVAVAWWRRADGAPTWGEMCVICLLALSGLDAVAYLFASPGRPVRRPRRRPCHRLHRGRRSAARAAGRAGSRPRGRARACAARGRAHQPRPSPP